MWTLRTRRTSLSSQFPAVASSLLINGTVLSHTSLIGPGHPNLHPFVWQFIDSLPQDQRENFSGTCAESALISDQLWQLDAHRGDGGHIGTEEAVSHFQGAAITSRMVRGHGDPDHGKPITPCAACSSLLNALRVRTIP
ncbi:YwqJ-related putative deaminase [Streptomyces sp. NBC_01471]|uniref:YwqJ-related putative deaminase n=1 Tax=Streptomyces sp. NBC_01471 TaxID=2903879 RepID=UPI00352D1A62